MRFLCLIILLISCCLLPGCQSHEFSSDRPIKITLWHGINPPENRDVFNSLVEEFNQTHSNVRVEALYIGQSEGQLPKILASVASGQPPDLLWHMAQLTGKLSQLNALVPLENWFNKLAIKEEIDPAMRESMELENHIFSVPFGTSNTAIFYRPSLFKQAGITQIPKTWDEFKATAKKLTEDTDRDGRIDRYGMFVSVGKKEWTVFIWLPFIFSAQGELLENNRPNLVNAGTIKALQFAADLVNKDKVAMLSAPERGYELDNFISGNVAMQVTGPWTLGQLKGTKIDYDVFPIPVAEKPATVVGGENLFLFKTNPQREQAALEFLEYILSDKFQTNWALKTGYLPINIKSQQSPEYQKFIAENPVIKVFLQQMQWARSRPIIPEYTNLSENLGRAIEASILGKKTPEVALKESQKRLELLFNDN